MIEYFQALDRLRIGKPIRVAKETRITNDSVALEAGRGKGSIKKSRPIFSDLIVAIGAAAEEQVQPVRTAEAKLDRIKHNASHYRHELELALARETSLLYEVYALKKKLAALTGGKVLPLRSNKDS